MEGLIELLAPVAGFWLGTMILSRAVACLMAAAQALKNKQNIALAVALHSGPWLVVGVSVWAYYVLSQPHERAWVWFFGAVVVAIPTMIAVAVVIHRRRKRAKSLAGSG